MPATSLTKGIDVLHSRYLSSNTWASLKKKCSRKCQNHLVLTARQKLLEFACNTGGGKRSWQGADAVVGPGWVVALWLGRAGESSLCRHLWWVFSLLQSVCWSKHLLLGQETLFLYCQAARVRGWFRLWAANQCWAGVSGPRGYLHCLCPSPAWFLSMEQECTHGAVVLLLGGSPSFWSIPSIAAGLSWLGMSCCRQKGLCVPFIACV